MFGCRLPSPAGKTLHTWICHLSAIAAISRSTSGSFVRGMTASCTTRSGAIRPIAPNAFFLPCQSRARSSSFAATRTVRAPEASLGADEGTEQVVAVHFAIGVAERHDLAAGENDLEREHVIQRHAVF